MSGGSGVFHGAARLSRGVVLGTLVLALSLAGHTAVGGGELPGLQALVVLLALSILVSISVADKRRSALWLSVEMAGLQVLLHVVATAVMAHPGHAAGLIPSTSMLAGHALATIVAAGALAHADDLWARWEQFVADVRRDFGLVVAAVPASPQTIAASPTVPMVQRHITRAVRRRGPPALSFS